MALLYIADFKPTYLRGCPRSRYSFRRCRLLQFVLREVVCGRRGDDSLQGVAPVLGDDMVSIELGCIEDSAAMSEYPTAVGTGSELPSKSRREMTRPARSNAATFRT